MLLFGIYHFFIFQPILMMKFLSHASLFESFSSFSSHLKAKFFFWYHFPSTFLQYAWKHSFFVEKSYYKRDFEHNHSMNVSWAFTFWPLSHLTLQAVFFFELLQTSAPCPSQDPSQNCGGLKSLKRTSLVCETFM